MIGGADVTVAVNGGSKVSGADDQRERVLLIVVSIYCIEISFISLSGFVGAVDDIV